MVEKKSLFRRVFETMAEGRSRQAQRYVDSYLQSHGLDRRSRKLTDR